MKKTKQIQKTITVTEISCDICGQKGEYECMYCKRDLCDYCLEWLQPNPLTDESDIYVHCVCKNCYSEMERLSKTTIPLKEMYNEALEEAEKKLRARVNDRKRSLK